MKNSFIVKNIRRTLLKQLIFPVLLFIASLAALLEFPRENYFFPRPLNYKSQYENFYNRDLPYVTVSVPELLYTGSNYNVNGHTDGRYYYTLNDGFCQFYLLDREPAPASAKKENGISLKGRLVRLNEVEYQSLLKGMAASLGWTVSSLEKITAPYAVSTLPYPVYLNFFFHVLAYGSLILSLADIICSLFYIWEPQRSPTFRYLGAFGEIRTLLPKVEIEMKHVSVAQAGNIYLTPGYLVNIDTVRSLILPLESILWIYYHSRILHLPGFLFRMSYTLRIVAVDGKSYEFTKKKKEDLDYILSRLAVKNDAILLGYSEENKKRAKELLQK